MKASELKQVELIGSFIDIGINDLRIYVDCNKKIFKWLISKIFRA